MINKSDSSWFKDKKVLITLGPTREYLDTVRYISNASSGRMGIALARECSSRGAHVFLVAGPGVAGLDKFPSRKIVSAAQMMAEAAKIFPDTDVFISAAAVADFRPEKTASGKLHRGKRPMSIKLLPNPDILFALTKAKKKQFCVGFALEDPEREVDGQALEGLNKAKEKMKKKRCDLMVLNSTESMESDYIDATIIFPRGQVLRLGKITKQKCSQKICLAIIEAAQTK